MSESRRRFLTTPIYYASGEPHLGHAYTTILADVLARFYRQNGDDVLFLTGTDEHGQKIQEEAARRGMEPLALCDQMAQRCSAQALRSRVMRTSPMASRGSARVISIAVTNSQPSSL